MVHHSVYSLKSSSHLLSQPDVIEGVVVALGVGDGTLWPIVMPTLLEMPPKDIGEARTKVEKRLV